MAKRYSEIEAELTITGTLSVDGLDVYVNGMDLAKLIRAAIDDPPAYEVLASHRSTPAHVTEEQITRAWAEYDALRALLSDPENLARRFHETYERLAPEYGYWTRKKSAVPWEAVPIGNKLLMIATCSELLDG